VVWEGRSREAPPYPDELVFYDQEVAVKTPRIAIASVMLAVAIAALDFGAIRAFSDARSRSCNQLVRGPKDPAEFDRIEDSLIRVDLLVSGALPMGNILAVGLLVYQRRRSHLFLLGFAVFGAAALAVYIAAVSCVTYEQLWPYLDLVLDPLRKSFGSSPNIVYSAVVYLTFAVMLVLPQMAFALIGGLIFRRFRVAERRVQDSR
jgi:hypothetical protein